jgi:putative MFS transporter
VSQQDIIIRSQRDIIDLINRGVIQGGNSLAIVFIALGGTFIDAYDFTSLGIGAVQLREQLHLSPLQRRPILWVGGAAPAHPVLSGAGA